MSSLVEMPVKRPLTPELYYRLPWNLADNAITWLEPTTACNIHCQGCYRENKPESHTPLKLAIKDLETLKNMRRTDGISIAGGEPLIYPEIVELVRYIASQGWKPIINSNGHALTPDMVKELKNAGLFGFTFHVDSHQKRPGWTGKNEAELNLLRLKLAEITSEAGDGEIACSFNATIYRDTLQDVPMLTKWAQTHMDIVQTMVFILYRSLNFNADMFDYSVNGEQIDPSMALEKLVYENDISGAIVKDITAQEAVDKIRETSIEYEPCAFLNGTEDPRSMKWLLSIRVGNKDKIFGYMDSKFAELAQTVHHFLYGTYLGYSKPALMKNFQKLLPLAFINKSVRKILTKIFPKKYILKAIYMQAIMIIQPVDVLADGRQNMCDSCPDAILHQNKLTWSCRLDEIKKLGGLCSMYMKGKN